VVALGGTQTRKSLHGTRSLIGCVCQLRAAAIARKAGGSLNLKTRQPLVWGDKIFARWLSPRLTPRLDRPGQAGRRTGPRSTGRSTRFRARRKQQL